MPPGNYATPGYVDGGRKRDKDYCAGTLVIVVFAFAAWVCGGRSVCSLRCVSGLLNGGLIARLCTCKNSACFSCSG